MKIPSSQIKEICNLRTVVSKTHTDGVSVPEIFLNNNSGPDIFEMTDGYALKIYEFAKDLKNNKMNDIAKSIFNMLIAIPNILPQMKTQIFEQLFKIHHNENNNTEALFDISKVIEYYQNSDCNNMKYLKALNKKEALLTKLITVDREINENFSDKNIEHYKKDLANTKVQIGKNYSDKDTLKSAKYFYSAINILDKYDDTDSIDEMLLFTEVDTKNKNDNFTTFAEKVVSEPTRVDNKLFEYYLDYYENSAKSYNEIDELQRNEIVFVKNLEDKQESHLAGIVLKHIFNNFMPVDIQKNDSAIVEFKKDLVILSKQLSNLEKYYAENEIPEKFNRIRIYKKHIEILQQIGKIINNEKPFNKKVIANNDVLLGNLMVGISKAYIDSVGTSRYVINNYLTHAYEIGEKYHDKSLKNSADNLYYEYNGFKINGDMLYQLNIPVNLSVYKNLVKELQANPNMSSNYFLKTLLYIEDIFYGDIKMQKTLHAKEFELAKFLELKSANPIAKEIYKFLLNVSMPESLYEEFLNRAISSLRENQDYISVLDICDKMYQILYKKNLLATENKKPFITKEQAKILRNKRHTLVHIIENVKSDTTLPEDDKYNKIKSCEEDMASATLKLIKYCTLCHGIPPKHIQYYINQTRNICTKYNDYAILKSLNEFVEKYGKTSNLY
ncbi:MAG: hypothetical protein MJ237_03125 [bacterium]|nr:hypothetical protein [bacterium]